MSDTLNYIIIFVAMMFFMHGVHSLGGMGSCGGHSHGSHLGHGQKDNESADDDKKENYHQR